MAKNRTYSLNKSVPWKGSWYYRKDGTWRNGRTGRVVGGTLSSGPIGTTKGYEGLYKNVYGSDSRKPVQAQLLTKKQFFRKSK